MRTGRSGGWLSGRWVWAGALLCALSAAMIIVVGSSGLSGDYAVASTGVPATLSGLTASWSGSTVSLSWNNPGDDSIDKYQYQITTGRSHGDDDWVDIDSSGPSTDSYTISGVTGLGNRNVHLRAHNSSGNGTVVTISVAPVPVKLESVGTGQCAIMGSGKVFQAPCFDSSRAHFRFYPISGMAGFFQVEGVGRGKCVEESQVGLLVTASCAVRARGESAAAFETRLSRQAFGFGPSSGSGAVSSSYEVGSTYTLRRKGVSGSCWTVPGTVAVPPRDETQMTNASCDGSRNSQWTLRDASYTTTTTQSGQ